MSCHRAAEIAGHHDCGEDRGLWHKVEYYQSALGNDDKENGRFRIAIARDDFRDCGTVMRGPDPGAGEQLPDDRNRKEPAGPKHPAGSRVGARSCTSHGGYLQALGYASTL